MLSLCAAENGIHRLKDPRTRITENRLGAPLRN